MKKIITICLVAALMPLHIGAQKQNEKAALEECEKQELIIQSKAKFDAKTIDKVGDVKKLVGKTICLRPDYVSASRYGSRELENAELTIKRVKYVPLLNQQMTETITFKKADRLVVDKAKKDELSVRRGEEKLKIASEHFFRFMLASDAEEVTSSIVEDYNQRKADEANAQKAAAEKAARDRADAEAAALQKNLNTYYENLKRMPKAIEGPIAVEIPERAYSGAVAYWKSRVSSDKLDTYRDEKFLLNPQKFPIVYEKYREQIESGSNNINAKQIARLSTLQKDTFGIYSHNEFIDLRTGEVFMNNDLIKGMWESVHYLNMLKDIPMKPYDGTISLRAIAEDGEAPYREKILESLVGEKVFLLDEMKYDEITAVEEKNTNGDLTLYLKEKGKYDYWTTKCIAVKWYEQLQKFVGKKIIENYDLTLFGYNRIWREDYSRRDIYTVVKFEVKDKRFNMYIKNDEGRTETIDAVEKCGLLAYPINMDEEWNKKQETRKCLYDRRGYFSYDAVYNTTPRKPADVKKQEALDKARNATLTAKMNKLREHRLIGTSLATFTNEWPSARLINTTTSSGITIQVYRLYDYQIVFRNGYCVSQTNY